MGELVRTRHTADLVEAWRVLADPLYTGILVTEGPEHRVCYRNPAFDTLASTDGEVVGRPLTSALNGTLVDAITPLLEAAGSGAPPASAVVDLTGASPPLQCCCVVSPLIVDQQPTGTIVQLHDISEVAAATRRHARVEQEAREVNQRLLLTALHEQELSEAARLNAQGKADFLSAVSHELRTPLNALLGHSELLDMEAFGPLTEAQQRSVKRISLGAKHLKELINDVLDFQRLEATGSEVSESTVDANELGREVVTVVSGLAENRVDLRLDLSSTPVPMRTDAPKLRQVLINLLGNGIKFTEKGWVELRVRSLGGESAAFTVTDTGIGIAEGDLEEIFTPFHQLQRGYSRMVDGTGLGLSISNHLVRLLGGTIRVESTPGKGSAFEIVVPVRLPAGRA